MMRRTAFGFCATSIPSTNAVPASGLIRVVSTLTTVVLPAPFGPSNAFTVPRGTDRSSPASA